MGSILRSPHFQILGKERHDAFGAERAPFVVQRLPDVEDGTRPAPRSEGDPLTGRTSGPRLGDHRKVFA